MTTTEIATAEAAHILDKMRSLRSLSSTILDKCQQINGEIPGQEEPISPPYATFVPGVNDILDRTRQHLDQASDLLARFIG